MPRKPTSRGSVIVAMRNIVRDTNIAASDRIEAAKVLIELEGLKPVPPKPQPEPVKDSAQALLEKFNRGSNATQG